MACALFVFSLIFLDFKIVKLFLENFLKFQNSPQCSWNGCRSRRRRNRVFFRRRSLIPGNERIERFRGICSARVNIERARETGGFEVFLLVARVLGVDATVAAVSRHFADGDDWCLGLLEEVEIKKILN